MKKNLLITTLCIFLGITLAGCGGGGNEANNSTGGPPQSSSEGSRKEVLIWDYFETDAQKVMIKDLCDGFNESQEEFEVKHVYVPFSDYEKQLTLGLASGELPDLVIMDGCGMASFAAMDLFKDISDADIKWDEYIQGPLETTMLDGKHYGIPFAANCTALFYNKDLFDAQGLSYPTAETTWDEFKVLAKELSKDGVTGFGNAATGTDEGTFQCLQWLYTAGGNYEDVSGGIDAYTLMQDMVSEGSWTKDSVNWTQSDVNNNFMAGNIAMQQNGPWQLPGIAKDAPDLNYGVVPLPRRDENAGQATSILGGESMGVVNKEDISGALAFVKYYDQTEIMIEAMKVYGSFPPKTEAAHDSYWMDDPIQKEFIKQLETSIPRGPSPSWPSYSQALQKGFQEALTSAKTPEKVAEDTQAAIDTVN